MGSLPRGWGLRWSQGPPEMRLVGGAMGYGSTMQGCGRGALMRGLWAVLLLGADGSGSGPASRWYVWGQPPSTPGLQGAKPKWTLSWRWTGVGTGLGTAAPRPHWLPICFPPQSQPDTCLGNSARKVRMRAGQPLPPSVRAGAGRGPTDGVSRTV